MRERTGRVARHPKTSLTGDRSMNAFRTIRTFALVCSYDRGRPWHCRVRRSPSLWSARGSAIAIALAAATAPATAARIAAAIARATAQITAPRIAATRSAIASRPPTVHRRLATSLSPRAPTRQLPSTCRATAPATCRLRPAATRVHQPAAILPAATRPRAIRAATPRQTSTLRGRCPANWQPQKRKGGGDSSPPLFGLPSMFCFSEHGSSLYGH